MIPFYRLIFKRVFKLSWRHKWLWALGFFAAFIGNGSVYEALTRSFNNMSEGRSIFFTLREYAQTGVAGMISLNSLTNLWHSDVSAFVITILGLLAFLCVVALLICFGVFCQAGLVQSVVHLDQNKKAGLKKSFQIGYDRFWPVFELNVITKVVLFGILTLIVWILSLLVFGSVWLMMLVYILSLVIFIVCSIIIYFLTIYGTAFAVLRKNDAFAALKSAWTLFIKNAVLNLEMGLLLFIINMALVFLFIIAMFIVLSPFLLLYALFLFSSAGLGVVVMSTLMMFLILALMILFGAWWSAFQLGCWALLFEELVLKGGQSKLRRLFDFVKSRRKKRK